MSISSPAPDHSLRTARVLRVEEDACDVWDVDRVRSVPFAPVFPGPRVERVSPGHLVAVATGPGDVQAVVWRWYDAVVLGVVDDGSIRLWELAHGEVTAQPRSSYLELLPGSRAWASAGLPGGDWWVAAGVDNPAGVELAEVEALYTGNELWPAAFER